MIIIHDFGIGLEEYEARGKENEFPVFDRCPGCNCFSQRNLHRNGYHLRYGIDEEDQALPIPICRFRCLACEVNISILPDFLIPYYQHTLHAIIDRVHRFLKGKKVDGCRQHLAQQVKRFYKDIPWLHSLFIDLGNRIGFSQDRKKEALKYMKMIQDLGESTFFRRSWGHLSSYFMGTLILPYLGR
jgi:hypothetical protein